MTSLQSNRSSGVLLHPTSLPAPFGIGDFGNEAFGFVDFLVDSGQSLWQVLPLHPTGYGNSPYQSLSAFAGNTLLIDPRQLVDAGWLSAAEIDAARFPDEHVDFRAAREFKDGLLHKAYQNFIPSVTNDLRAEFEEFCEISSWWLNDYALFRALKDAHDGRDWINWDRELSQREPAALQNARSDLGDQILEQKFFQFLFFRQWNALRIYCRERGIRIIGDLPLFVAHDSADVWADREYFKLGHDGTPTVVAGVPPDYFSETGQLWGNPLYDWEVLRADGFRWWIDRVKFALEQFDFLRVDHFRGFAACWEIPAGESTAQNGHWVSTPGRELFAALKNSLGDLPIIAENLGVITSDVESLREEFGFPGMRVLQFAFGGDSTNVHLPHNYTSDVIVYTGTHDSDTTIGWFKSLGGHEKAFCLDYLKGDGNEINWDLIKAAIASAAQTAIIPFQDILGLGTEARMNLPNTTSGNWVWRYARNALDESQGERLRGLTDTYGRIRAST